MSRVENLPQKIVLIGAKPLGRHTSEDWYPAINSY